MSAVSDLLPVRPRPRWGTASLNVLLGAAVVGAGGGAYYAVGPSATPAAAPRTATAARGVVLSSVSASGTASSPTSLPINFTASGQLVSVNVKPGQRVRAGHVLGRIDPTSAQLAVRNAESSLHSAQASLRQTLAGATPEQKAEDEVALRQAAQSVGLARASVVSSKQTAAMDRKTLATSVAQARAALVSAGQTAALDKKT